MQTDVVLLKKYIADEGKVFDWVEPHYEMDESEQEIQVHLYVKQLFLSKNDSIENYVEINAPEED